MLTGTIPLLCTAPPSSHLSEDEASIALPPTHMKFSDTLRFDANPAWWDYYLPYDRLKTHLAELRTLYIAATLPSPHSPTHDYFAATPQDDDLTDDDADPISDVAVEVDPRIPSASENVLAAMKGDGHGRIHSDGRLGGALGGLPQMTSQQSTEFLDAPVELTQEEAARQFRRKDNHFFRELLDCAMVVDKFFLKLNKELDTICSTFISDASQFVSWGSRSNGNIENTPLLYYGSDEEAQTNFVPSKEQLDVFQRRIVNHYMELKEAITYSQVNLVAYERLLKRHDQLLRTDTMSTKMEDLREYTSFTDARDLERFSSQLEYIYAHVFEQGNLEQGKKKLTLNLRDILILQHNTIWRDALRRQRMTGAFRFEKTGTPMNDGDQTYVKFRPKWLPVSVAFILFVLLLVFPGIVETMVVKGDTKYTTEILAAANRCLALTAGVVVLWAFEGIPLYVTSFIVFILSVVCRVFLDTNGVPMDFKSASSQVFQSLSSSTTILIICVYVFGAALSKFDIDKFIASLLLSRLTRAHHLLAAVMYLSVLASIFISNVAAPVLLISVLTPTISAMRQMSNRPFIQCLLLGVMVSSNVGGFASPIASPQSAVALGLLTNENSISFMKWLYVALPLCLLMVTAFYFTLCVLFRPASFMLPLVPRSTASLGPWHWIVILTLVTTIMIWSVPSFSAVFGSAGMVAAIPIVVFFGTGILEKEDFNSLPWDVVLLVSGGSVLGAGVQSCKLLEIVATWLATLGHSNLFWTYAVLVGALALIANAVSHTVSAIIFLPLFFSIGVSLGHPQLLVFGGACAASCAMALPVSSFPNISTTQVEDEKGETYVTNAQVLRVGTIMTGIASLIMLTLGYVWMIEFGL